MNIQGNQIPAVWRQPWLIRQPWPGTDGPDLARRLWRHPLPTRKNGGGLAGEV